MEAQGTGIHVMMSAKTALELGCPIRGIIGFTFSALSIILCTYAASGIFVAVLRMSEQRLLVAYPVGLLYGCFALLSVFNIGAGLSSA